LFANIQSNEETNGPHFPLHIILIFLTVGTLTTLLVERPEKLGSISGKGAYIFLHIIQTNSGAHIASYPKGTGALYLVVKRQEREADHSPQTGAEFKGKWICTSTPHMRSWHRFVTWRSLSA
jgi:hypothetical protein